MASTTSSYRSGYFEAWESLGTIKVKGPLSGIVQKVPLLNTTVFAEGCTQYL